MLHYLFSIYIQTIRMRCVTLLILLLNYHFNQCLRPYWSKHMYLCFYLLHIHTFIVELRIWWKRQRKNRSLNNNNDNSIIRWISSDKHMRLWTMKSSSFICSGLFTFDMFAYACATALGNDNKRVRSCFVSKVFSNYMYLEASKKIQIGQVWELKM